MPDADLPSWTDQTVGDATRMNRHGIVSGTGTYLAGVDKSKHKLLHCTQTGSGFTLDHLYLCRADGTGADDITDVAVHYHTSSSTQGGDFADVIMANKSLVDIFYASHLDITEWVEAVSGTGSSTLITNDPDFDDQEIIRLETGATSASTSSRRLPGLSVNFAKQSAFQCLVDISDTTSIAAKWGYSVENASAADDNTRKYGFVICTSVNGNWFARSADGDSRSDSDMGEAFGTDITNLYAEKKESASSIFFYINGADELEKTNDVPVDSFGSPTNLFRFTVKNNTAANRVVDLCKLRMTYHTTGQGWL